MAATNPLYTQLHLGLGAFHRAHQAYYLQKLHDLGDHHWQIVGGNLRPDAEETITALHKQQGLYTLETVSPAEQRTYTQIQTIKHVVKWQPDLQQLITIATSPNTHIISFTVTEAGYYFDPNECLNLQHPEIASDICSKTPSTIYGALSAMLSARMAADTGPITLLNCDNLQKNGQRFETWFKQFLTAQKNHTLLDWCRQNIACPNSMVDRITPRPTPEISARVKSATGMEDQAPVMAEEYLQWAIEDNFIADRPTWEEVGVEMVKDVAPYEETKIRILNAAHSGIAWAGALTGYHFIHQAIRDPKIQRLTYEFITDDVIPGLRTDIQSDLINLETYRDTVITRFSNPFVEDTIQRVAMDGFAKIPGFILPTIDSALGADKNINASAKLLALFVIFLIAYKKGKIPFEYQDQAADKNAITTITQSDDPVTAFVMSLGITDSTDKQQRLIAAIRDAMPIMQSTFNQ